MTRKAFIAAAAGLALVLSFAPNDASAARMDFVEVSSTATQRVYDLVADAEGGGPIFALVYHSDFTVGAALVSSIAWTDCSPGSGPGPFGVCQFSLGDFSWASSSGAGSFGSDLGISGFTSGGGWTGAPFTAPHSGVYGRLTINHLVLNPGDTITLSNTSTSYVTSGGVPVTGTDGPTRLTFGVPAPEPGALVLLGMAIGGMAFLRRRSA